jgi:hypothetical protein
MTQRNVKEQSEPSNMFGPSSDSNFFLFVRAKMRAESKNESKKKKKENEWGCAL